ncbi:flavodoxin family protein [Candidatus Bipolaricaulota bacterium]
MNKRALILDGRIEDDTIAERSLELAEAWFAARHWDVTTRKLRELDIADCLGCFGCWVKSPGECVIDDAGRDVARSIVNSDVVVYLTPIQFGGYSYQLKKAVDRSIPIISPYFRMVNGEVHHKKRYDSYPSMAAFGWSVDRSKEVRDVFEMVVKRNAINMMAPQTAVGFLESEDAHDIEQQVARVLGEVCGR